MRWQERRRSQNVEDRRGSGGRKVAVGGLGGLVIVLVAMFFGADPSRLMEALNESGATAGGGGPAVSGTNPEEDLLADFVKVVLADTEDVWNDLFQAAGRQYQEPELVLFSGQVRSACGMANSAVGPFYCPADSKVYIDLSFYDDLKRRHQAPGDFAQAYVIAHEIGHHIQNLLGISDRVHQARSRLSEEENNQMSVRLELQADFLGGVWADHAHRTKQILEEGDVEEALNAASAIGDDRLQKQAQGYVVPESFTHGTSEQRVRWFRKGLTTGDMNQGDTFQAKQL